MGNKKYYLKNRNSILQKQKEYNSRPEIKLQRQKYIEDNKERILSRSKEYHSSPVIKERKYQYYQTHKEERKLYPSLQKDVKSAFNKEYRKTHTREHKAESRRFYKRHKEKFYIKSKKWMKDNPNAWRQIALKSQIKYLKKIGERIKTDYRKIPYLYRNWSSIIKEQYNNKCVVCGSIHNLHTHHIFHKSKYPELSLNLNNGIPLCLVHHNEVHGRWSHG